MIKYANVFSVKLFQQYYIAQDTVGTLYNIFITTVSSIEHIDFRKLHCLDYTYHKVSINLAGHGLVLAS